MVGRELVRAPRTREEQERLAEASGFIVYPQSPEPGGALVRLWDVVEGAWTSPMTQDGIEIRLRKVVYKCLECNYASVWPQDIRAHVLSVRNQAEDHEDAEPLYITTERGSGYQCSACNAKNPSRSSIYGHISLCQSFKGTHEQPEGYEVIKRFVMTQPPHPATPAVAPLVNAPSVEPLEENHGNRRTFRSRRKKILQRRRQNNPVGKA